MEELEEETPEKEELDWWSKYYASLEELRNQVQYIVSVTKQCFYTKGGLGVLKCNPTKKRHGS